MTWKVSGELIETCSCNMLCPCWFGEADLMLMDQGYCGTTFLLRIKEGNHEGTDLSGQAAVVSLHFPGPTLFDAKGTGRVYVDKECSEAEQAALEAILQGGSGGGMEVPASLLDRWLPTKRVPIEVTEDSGVVSASLPEVGDIRSRRLLNEAGEQMTLKNSAFSMAFGFLEHSGDLAPSEGTEWKDPDMPVVWRGRSGMVGQVDWSG
jgi:hypothetical protein